MLRTLVSDMANVLVQVDSSRVPFRNFQPGVGPYGEPQLLKEIARALNASSAYQGRVVTRRNPDLLIKGLWALEFKTVRPFGDNGREAENWSVNLLHPYEGNVSALGDCLKLLSLASPEKKAVVVISYEHDPPRIPVLPLVNSFELIADKIMKIQLGPRIEESRRHLVHPVHQKFTVFTWEILGRTGEISAAQI